MKQALFLADAALTATETNILSMAQCIIMKIKVKIMGTKIHDVGYRPLLVQKGLEFGLTGLNVRNKMEDRKQVVQVLAEGEDEEIEEFIDFIKNNYPENARVEKVEWREYSNTVSRIESAMNLQLLEQMNKGIPAILDLSETGKEVKMELQKIGNKQDNMLEKQDNMLEKQDENTKVIKEESQKIRRDLSSRLDRTNTLLEKRFRKMEDEINKITKALIKAGIEV
jgi:acylphosphatase